MTIEIQLRALLFFFFFFFFFLYLIKPRFYYISAGLMRSASHGDVSMVDYQKKIHQKHHCNNILFSIIWEIFVGKTSAMCLTVCTYDCMQQ